MMRRMQFKYSSEMIICTDFIEHNTSDDEKKCYKKLASKYDFHRTRIVLCIDRGVRER